MDNYNRSNFNYNTLATENVEENGHKDEYVSDIENENETDCKHDHDCISRRLISVEVIDGFTYSLVSNSSSSDSLFSVNHQHVEQMERGDHQILIPDYQPSKFSFRKLWMFTGPGFLMSIAFLDPGNIESDLRSGAIAQYKLLWVLFSSTIMGLLMQRLSARLGVVTGQHLAELCYRYYHKIPRLLLWIMIEIAIIGSDMQEVIGTAIALYLLSAKRIPTWIGVLITIMDTFTFLFLDKYGLRKLEFFFGFLIAVMAFSFGYEYVISQPPKMEILKGMLIPWCSNCNSKDLLQAIGIIGAILMPHNFYLHSALVRTRKIDRKNEEAVKEANYYYFVETCIALFVSFSINVFVVSVFAYGMFHVTNNEILDKCMAYPSINGTEVFPKNDNFIEADIYKGGIFLGCSFGLWAMYIWGVGILAAGQSSTMTGTYAGQFVMEGFLNLKWARWKRVLFTRIIAILPTFWLAFRSTHSSLTDLNDMLNATMTLQLPFAIIPTIAFTSNSQVMGKFRNGRANITIAAMLSTTVILINTFFVINQLDDLTPTAFTYTLIVIYGLFYLIFISYLLLHMFVFVGYDNLLQYPWIRDYVVLKETTPYQHQDAVETVATRKS